MVASLFVLGYGFYMSARMFWVYRTDSGAYRPLYFVIMVAILSIHFIFSMILFTFLLSNALFTGTAQIFNTILAVFWFSGAGLVTSILKYHINALSSESNRKIKLSFKGIKRVRDPSTKNLFSVIKNLRADLKKDRKRFHVSPEGIVVVPKGATL